jgi:hypothetical protein
MRIRSMFCVALVLSACTAPAQVGAPGPVVSKSVSPTPSPSVTPPPSSPPAAAVIPARTCGAAGARRTVTFRVAVDRGLPVTSTVFAGALRRVLCDRRSWIASSKVRFRYDPAGALLIRLASPDHTQRRCLQLIGLSVARKYSCATRFEVVLNSARWFGGSPYWPGPTREYRSMLTNHEVGHALGMRHQMCPADGAVAPVMMQQSKGLTSPNGKTCKRNPWPLREELTRLR